MSATISKNVEDQFYHLDAQEGASGKDSFDLETLIKDIGNQQFIVCLNQSISDEQLSNEEAATLVGVFNQSGIDAGIEWIEVNRPDIMNENQETE